METHEGKGGRCRSAPVVRRRRGRGVGKRAGDLRAAHRADETPLALE